MSKFITGNNLFVVNALLVAGLIVLGVSLQNSNVDTLSVPSATQSARAASAITSTSGNKDSNATLGATATQKNIATIKNTTTTAPKRISPTPIPIRRRSSENEGAEVGE